MSALLLLLGALTEPGQIDEVCAKNFCQVLVIRQGTVRYITHVPNRNLIIGRYAKQGQTLVPKTEAPLLVLHSKRGWRVVVSAFLEHTEFEARLRLRFIAPDHSVRTIEEVMVGLDDVSLANHFGGDTEVFAITTEEEHSYNASTEIWFLPRHDDPKRLLLAEGTIKRFVDFRTNAVAGVFINRETYDGRNAATKGHVTEFWNGILHGVS